jgi:hypothetical protein
MDRTLCVPQGGKLRELTLEEALQHRTYQEAINGNRAAQREVLNMIEKRDKWLAAKRPHSGCEEVIEPDPDNAHEALLLLGIAELDTCGDRLLLQPWAVQAALRRPGRRRLSAEDVSRIKRRTRDAETQRWPAGVCDEPGD